MSFSHYGELCTEVYELTKKVGQSLGGDIEYYLETLKDCDGRILEAMVGSGRVIVPLLESGLTVDGVDYSPAMLHVCRKHCEDRELHVDLYEADLQHVSLPHLYEAIIIPAGSFLLIEDRDASISVLENLYDHLEPEGRLILDLFLPDLSVNIGDIHTSTFSLPSGDTMTMEEKVVNINLFHQQKTSYLKYEKWRNGKLLQTELQRFGLRWYGVEEFVLLLKSIGFSQVHVCANYDSSKKPSHNKETFVFEAIK
ncbi:class I SAM-dependent methyltransferase [Bacillus sp. CGMCC 1.16541]|uniref:class I SAM-dependent methyltransferase n=1 Tax=Bacillus sp. CGMCC 1.16541 TaxID=2185143 RepID=UPI000D738EDA|nr:class I SAM-dependent methyltransferase [Bacillus sp. CGMCC 1.16541]